MKSFSFSVLYKSKESQARVGIINTPHGDITTPAFIPVGTQATVKSLTPEEIRDVGTQMFFVNTYHMAMRPGIDVVKRLGGLHTFMRWDGPIITDSGGFQVFSLAKDEQASLVKITEDGVTFRSHWDGSYHTFTPELSMKYQCDLGSDIHIAFDDCTPYGVSYEDARVSMERTHRWAVRSKHAHNGDFALYGSIQGSVFEDLRKESADFIVSLDTDGIAIGGMAVGESKGEMKCVLDWVCPILPENKPRHALGIGEIDDIFTLIEHGIDTFDCVQPTRLARVGFVYSGKRLIDIQKRDFSEDMRPIDANCQCYTCKTFSRAYIHHLFRVRELLAYRLATIHNLFYIHALVAEIRSAIQEERFHELRQQWM
ncbi:MAG: tRNA guanosine(34) transglycosylase Tgt [Patescibacteria group bacterium]|nr:tRNA guanosine(34) transglycosylase Tgt [Patescibacteria group bacterium]